MWTALLGAFLVVIMSTPADAQRTPDAVRTDFLSVIDRPRVPAAPSEPRVPPENGYRQERLSIATERTERVPLLLVSRPGETGRRPVVIALHGTGGAKESMLPWMTALADRGFLAVGMDARHHGERAKPIPGLDDPYESAMLRAFRTGQGQPYLYDTVWDVLRLVDYLVTRPDVDPTRIGIVGNSKGGTEAYLVAAADPRIAVAVPLIGVQSFGWSLRHPAAWEARTWTFHGAVEAAAATTGESVGPGFMKTFYDRITPGLVDRFDGPAMLPLIAPRALLAVNGDSDPRSPMGGVREAVKAARTAYAAAGAADRFEFLLEEDAAHEVTPQARAAVLDWFTRWLKP